MTSPVNGCHNKPRPVSGAVTHFAQDGYGEAISEGWGYFSRPARYVEIRHVMTTDCQYTLRTPDPRCAGCVHEKRT